MNSLFAQEYLDSSIISLAQEKFKALAKPCGFTKEVFVSFSSLASLFIYFMKRVMKGSVLSYRVMSMDSMSAYSLS